MKLLLDTHVWFWAAVRPDSLSGPAAEAIADPANQLGLSAITVWELLVLARKGRIDIGADRQAWVRKHIVESPIPKDTFPLTSAIAARGEHLPDYENPDPADRFLAATALEHDLTLVTADRSLREYGRLRTLW